MLSYNIVLKLKGYIRTLEFDFKSTVAKLDKVQTIINTINSLTFETIPAVDKKLSKLFTHMGFKLPNRI